MPIEQPMPDNQYSLQSQNHRCLRRNERIHGVTAGTFKKRYANLMKSLEVQRYSTETELSKYAWSLKEERKPFTIKWSVFKRVDVYKAGGNSCKLCLEENLNISKSNKEKKSTKMVRSFF